MVIVVLREGRALHDARSTFPTRCGETVITGEEYDVERGTQHSLAGLLLRVLLLVGSNDPSPCERANRVAGWRHRRSRRDFESSTSGYSPSRRRGYDIPVYLPVYGRTRYLVRCCHDTRDGLGRL
jgi:hypothetical protein